MLLSCNQAVFYKIAKHSPDSNSQFPLNLMYRSQVFLFTSQILVVIVVSQETNIANMSDDRSIIVNTVYRPSRSRRKHFGKGKTTETHISTINPQHLMIGFGMSIKIPHWTLAKQLRYGRNFRK